MGESRDGVALTNLDQPLFDDAGATKRDLVDYLDAVAPLLVPVLRDRALSVIRVRPGQAPFMQKNAPKGTPDWVRTVTMWAESSQRDVSYVVCDDRRTLLWLANQRAVEYHPALWHVGAAGPAELVLDLDPPEGASFEVVVRVAKVVRTVLDDAGLTGAVKTSGAKGLHIFVPLDGRTDAEDAAAATRALAARVEQRDPDAATTAFIKIDRAGKVFVDATRAGGATVVAAYSPRIRPGVPVSFPLDWDELDDVVPSEITIRTVLERLEGRTPWHERMAGARSLPDDLVAEGHTIPIARVQAMHEGKRRRRAAGR